ncbi:MAG: NAD-dependent epimerase/dehydratase family protein [Bacteroidota bacterium]|jgi:CDP-paratose 2-epimerase
MKTIIITGAAGLIGSESAKFFCQKGYNVVGIDNDMRKYFFGEQASTKWTLTELESSFTNFKNVNIDIRDLAALTKVFQQYNNDIDLVIHAAAQPSHDWAAKEPLTDFTINANGTLNMLEVTRLNAPNAVFVFTSTNKVYGDTPNYLPIVEQETRWEIQETHPYFKNGIDEKMTIDNSKHSIFGASKVAADVMTQEYGKYFGMKTAIFRGGCLSGPNHSGAELHGFLAYLMKCAVTKKEYKIFGYKGKQVRDNIHSYDLVNMIWHFYENPRSGEVYNAGGSRFSNCSMIEAIKMCENITGNKMNITYKEENRIGDHIWYISDVQKFKSHYPTWQYRYGIQDILFQLFNALSKR